MTTSLPCDPALLDRLQNLPAEHIDSLIDILTDHGLGRVSLDSDIKKKLMMARHDSRPSRYDSWHLKCLAHELQQYGGHSVANLVRQLRDRSPVAYATIVNDVYKKLNGGSADEKTTEAKEQEIALALFGAAESELTLEERISRSTSAKVLTGMFAIEPANFTSKATTIGGLGSMLAAAGPKILPVAKQVGLRVNPFTAVAGTVALATQTAYAEAYRITIPFVAEMGWISLRSSLGLDTTSTDTPRPSSTKPSNEYPSKNENGIVVADEQGGALMTFTAFKFDTPASDGKKVPQEAVSAMNPLLSTIPSLAALAEQQRGNYVLCSIPFDALVNSKGGAEGSKRAMVMGAKGIQEHAHLSAPETLQNVLVSGAAWNILSSAVGQKHLHDINEKLIEIKALLDDLSDNVDNLRLETLNGLMGYMQSLLDHHASEGVNSRALDSLEQRLPELLRLETFFEQKIRKELKTAHAIEGGTTLSGRSSRSEIEASMERMRRWNQGYLQVAQLQIVSLWLLYKDQALTRYKSSAAAVLDRLGKLRELDLDCQQVYSAQIAMSSAITSNAADQRSAMRAKMLELCESIGAEQTNTHSWYKRVFEHRHQEMLLRFEEGQITDAQFVD